MVSGTGWADPVAVNHGNLSTFGFADGHAEGHKWTAAKVIKAAEDSSRGIESFYWDGGTPTNRDWVWVYDRFRYEEWNPVPHIKQSKRLF